MKKRSGGLGTLNLMSSGKATRKRSRGYLTYKNRKKELRRQVKAGRISREERIEKQREALQLYQKGDLSEQAKQAILRGWYGQQYVESGGTLRDRSAYSSGECATECVGARGFSCGCPCCGVNHGAAHGTEPHQVKVRGMTIAERVEAGVL